MIISVLPNFTEPDVESQDGKVFLITGGSSGIGFKLAKMLYAKHRQVYIAGRSEENARQAIKDIQTAMPTGGSLEFLQLELDDLSSIKTSTGNLFLASKYARKAGSTHNIVSVAHNPGGASTNLFRHTRLMRYLAWPLLHKAQLAALTSLFAGVYKETTTHNTGCYVLPWGRLSDNLKEDLGNAMRRIEEGGTGRTRRFWQFCEKETREYSRSDSYLDIVAIAKFKSQFSH
ncbi:putative short-chain dehydrogenase [Biscogniauxia mediterranea]|nr:putative short-chain dehydrogenase [Biscogniauxia mediterranea]